MRIRVCYYWLIQMAANETHSAQKRHSPAGPMPGEPAIGLAVGASDQIFTEHQRVVEALRESEERFRAVMEQAPFSLQVFSREGRTTRVNKAWEKLWGLSMEQVQDYNILKDPQLEATGVLRFIRRAFAGEAVEIPAICYDPNKTLPNRTRNEDAERWVGAFAYPIKGPEGEVREVVLAHQDITARKRAEEKLRESEARYRATFENAAMGIAHVALDGRLMLVNDALCKITGYSREELLVRTFAEITHPDDYPDNWNLARRALAEEISNYCIEKRYIRKDGSIVWVRVTASLLRDESGKPQMFIGMVEDVNDQKTASERLERIVQERTAALRDTVQQLETFSYSIVHDMRAPLRSMRSFAGILAEEYSASLDPQGRDYLSRIVSSASRLDALITDVLSYSRVSMNEAELSMVELDALVPDVIEHYPQFEKAVGKITIQRPLARVLGNPALLTQVVSNLVGNALKFMPSGREPRVNIRTHTVGNKVRLCIEDNGIGIAPEHQRKIFGLFERLHGPHEYAGTGVGLAIVSKAVERMGGTVTVTSEPGSGSTFEVELGRPPAKPGTALPPSSLGAASLITAGKT